MKSLRGCDARYKMTTDRLRRARRSASLVALFCILLAAADSTADWEQDRAQFRAEYEKRFPSVPIDDYVLGVYAIDQELRSQYDAINEFPPYEFSLDEGAALVGAPFSSGVSLLECLDRNPAKAAHEYPYFDVAQREVVTLAVAVNRCREINGEQSLNYRQQPMAEILAYLNFNVRHQRRRVTVPSDPAATRAYASGKQYFYTKRGQLNLSCADCHVTAAGRHLREQTLAPLLGAVNHYPVYGLSWGALGTLHQRFVGCLEQVRAQPSVPQSAEFRELEYFLAIMSNELPMSGPGIHR